MERGAILLEDMEISDEKWGYLKTLRDILEIYHEPTLELQTSNVSTISLTIPNVVFLSEALKRSEHG